MIKKLFSIFVIAAVIGFTAPPRAVLAANKVTLIVELEGGATLETAEAVSMGAALYNDTDSYAKHTSRIISAQLGVQADIRENVDENMEIGFTYTNLINGFSVTVSDGDIEKIKSLPNVKEVYRTGNYTFTETSEAEDAAPAISCCEAMGVSYMHNNGYGGEGQAVAIIDSELDVNHEIFTSAVKNPKYSKSDIADILKNKSLNVSVSANQVYKNEKIPFAYNYSKNNADVYTPDVSTMHGTHVAGIAAGKNGKLKDGGLFSGAAPETQIIFMAVSAGGVNVNGAALLAAADDASKLDVAAINMSLGEICDYEDKVLEKAVNTAVNAGILVSASAGNSGNRFLNYSTPPDKIDYSTSGTPACISNATAVAACVSDTLAMASFSSWGTNASLELKPEITAPGSLIYSSFPDDDYRSISGTSMAAPHVTGAAALMRQYIDENYPNASNKAMLMENMIMSGAQILYSDTKETIPYSPRNQGAGMLDLSAAVRTPVILRGDNGKTKISLKDNLTDTFNIEFTAENLTDTDAVYDIVEMSVITDSYKTSAGDGSLYISGSKLLSFTENLPDTVTVPADEAVTISCTVQLDKDELNKNAEIFTNGFFIEGFVTLKDSGENLPQINIPYTGFYGDWTAAPVFDDTYFNGGRLKRTYIKSGLNGDNCHVYSSSESCSCTYLGSNYVAGEKHNSDLSYVYDKALFDGEQYAGYSPNGDGDFDYLCIAAVPERTAANALLTIENESGKIVIKHEIDYLDKYVYNHVDIAGNLPDGDYTVKIAGALPYEGAKEESIEMRYYIDTEPPVITSCLESEKDGRKYINIAARDNRFISGFIATGKNENGEDISLYYPTAPSKNAEASIDITDITGGTLTVTAFDYAVNKVTYSGSDIEVNLSSTPILGADSTAIMFDLHNHTGADVTADIIAAAYDKDGILKCLSLKRGANLPAGASDMAFSFDKRISRGETVKLMIWDKLENMKPLGFYIAE